MYDFDQMLKYWVESFENNYLKFLLFKFFIDRRYYNEKPYRPQLTGQKYQ